MYQLTIRNPLESNIFQFHYHLIFDEGLLTNLQQSIVLSLIGKKSFINNERIVQLENVGFQWTVDNQLIRKTAWNELFSELLEFKKEWGHCDVLSKYSQYPKLGCWVSNQRRQYRLLKSGKKSFINNERIVQLDNVGFQWTVDSQLIRKTAWNERFSELLKFKKEWGHCDFLSKYAQYPKLGNWVSDQRSQYRLLKSGKKSLINNERIVQLEDVGFQWVSDSLLIHKTAWKRTIFRATGVQTRVGALCCSFQIC